MFHVDLELDHIIEEAVIKGASDIHFNPIKDGLVVRYRIGGLLQEITRIDKENGEKLINRIKVVSYLNLSERRLPQDGRWNFDSVTMRVSTLPSIYGETIVCRLLKNIGANASLFSLGISAELEHQMLDVLARPHGLFLICGPTGSGKSATLYALIGKLHSSSENIISLEDPVEAEIPGVVQVQINEKVGLTFAEGLRSILRQDPDTIIVGEIRDKETAKLAVEAALTGHRVLSTIHTNTACEVVNRLVDMGVEKYLIEATLNGVLSQRLVRRIPIEENRRIGVFELLKLPKENMNWNTLPNFLVETLITSAQKLIAAGITTVEELQRKGISI